MSRRRRLQAHLALLLILTVPLTLFTLTAAAGVGPYYWGVKATIVVLNGHARPKTVFAVLSAFLFYACLKAFELAARLGWVDDLAEIAYAREHPGSLFVSNGLLYGHLLVSMFAGFWVVWTPWPPRHPVVGWVLLAAGFVWALLAAGWLTLGILASRPPRRRSVRYEEEEETPSTDPNRRRWLVGIGVAAVTCLTMLIGMGMVLDALPARNTPPGNAIQLGNPAGELNPVALWKQPPPATDFAGIVAYWPFDEGKGTRASDASANALAGNLVGASWVGGVRGSALQFSAPGQYFDLGAAPQLNFPAGGSFTVSLWIQTRLGDGTILSFRNGKEPGADVYIGLEAGGMVKALVREDNAEWGVPAVATAGPVHDGGWHHLALTRVGAAVELFIDGQPRAKGTGANAAGAITTGWRCAAREMYWANVRPSGNPHWEGCLDELAVFNRALAADEIPRLAGR